MKVTTSLKFPAFSGKLKVPSMKAPAVSTAQPFWSNMKDACKPFKRPNVCWADARRTSRIELKSVTEAACAKAGGVFERGKTRTMTPGTVELDFISRAQAKKLGLKPGVVLRLCSHPNQKAPLIQVPDPETARNLAHQYQQKIRERIPEVAAAAAREVAGPNAPLGFDPEVMAAAAGRGLLGGIFKWGKR